MNEPDLFHAVDGGGNCFPGPCLPFSLVRLGPDAVNHNTTGYASGEDIRHFSHLHVVGAGGQGRYGNIGIVPLGFNGDERNISQMGSDEVATPGYYATTLQPRQGFGEMALGGGIRCELTSTPRCGLHRYRFPKGLEPHLRFNIGACIGGRSVAGQAKWIDSKTLVARSDVRGGWGHQEIYTVFARIELDREIQSSNFMSDTQEPSSTRRGFGPNLRGQVSLGDVDEVNLRVGISFVSPAQAQRHLEEEVGQRDFDAVRQGASNTWKELLRRFRVEGGSEEDQRLWSTLWMRLHTMPDDLGTDEVPWFNAKSRQFNNLFCLWDSVRCANSLFALIDPPLAEDLCHSLMEISEQTGWLPDAWILGASGQIQGGCSSAVLFSEALQKGLEIDPVRALDCLDRTQESPSPDPKLFGRHSGWQEDGFLSTEVLNCTSRCVEYAFHDHTTAIVAKAAGREDRSQALEQRSGQIWKQWRDEAGCFGPLDAEGQPVPFDPWKPQVRDFWNDPHFYEGTGHDYALTAWHLIHDIVDRHGGPEAFGKHLDAFMERCYCWKEINLHAPWLYHYIGEPHRSSLALRRIVDAHLQPGRHGMSDNEDMGAWSSWWLSAAMGLCPVPGSDLYLVGAPRFERIEIDIKGCDAPLVISTQGPLSATSVVVGAKLDRENLERAWVKHAEIASGAHLELQLSTQASNWGRREKPPRT